MNDLARPRAMNAEEPDVAGFTAALMRSDRRALARCITWVENETAAGAQVLGAIQGRLGQALVVGFTGSPGVGKSTLVNAFIKTLRERGRTVAIAAVDPSSPFSGGAILGDRIRMGEHAGDPGVFIRSIASRGQVGGLSLTTARIVELMDAAGFDVVIVETVGAGQSEHDIVDVADIRVVICTPGHGDEVQMVKAGILEIGDILVVNKFDLPQAEGTAARLAELVNLGRARPAPVLGTVAPRGEGVAELVDAVMAVAAERPAGRSRSLDSTRRRLASLVSREFERRVLDDNSTIMSDVCMRVSRGQLDFAAAVDELIALHSRPIAEI